MAMPRLALWLMGSLLLTVAAAPARAQDYPARPITLVVPFAPGGGVDLMARLVAGKLEQRLGKSFIIENKPGAGSIIAASYVQKSNPDGYTLLMAATSFATAPAFFPQIHALRIGHGPLWPWYAPNARTLLSDRRAFYLVRY